MSYGQSETIRRRLKRNYDFLIAVVGIAILPLIGPLEDYIAFTYSSVYSGIASVSIILTTFCMVMIGLVTRICRYVFGSGIN